jgi:hypothetical protein
MANDQVDLLKLTGGSFALVVMVAVAVEAAAVAAWALGGWAALAADLCIGTLMAHVGVQDRALISSKQPATGTAEIQQAYECYSGAVGMTK